MRGMDPREQTRLRSNQSVEGARSDEGVSRPWEPIVRTGRCPLEPRNVALGTLGMKGHLELRKGPV